ncbi:hypothetical protein ACFCZ1_13445 [Streptomyces sp. NPDC056224]|uniref:hypothetical protein n=1 Tax=Streptomyces sp. NPDC056224 TaxID=3345750 RepID=UPI0035E0C0F5
MRSWDGADAAEYGEAAADPADAAPAALRLRTPCGPGEHVFEPFLRAGPLAAPGPGPAEAPGPPDRVPPLVRITGQRPAPSRRPPGARRP